MVILRFNIFEIHVATYMHHVQIGLSIINLLKINNKVCCITNSI
ncbi:hypothetical protein HNQ59_000407 [Chitinivorax tropicus]|uniref:Uncharacterized protein n=1 Tax=Chitinivorax tropicus TaxID=714531 RepID=A0A840MHZ5_9PROT|nr:hypothetical protein [Chitinivorax tropicus]